MDKKMMNMEEMEKISGGGKKQGEKFYEYNGFKSGNIVRIEGIGIHIKQAKILYFIEVQHDCKEVLVHISYKDDNGKKIHCLTDARFITYLEA